MCTFQSFEKRGVLIWFPCSVGFSALPVSPIRNVFESLVQFAILEILGRYHTRTTTGIDHVVEVDGTGSTVFPRPADRYGASWVGKASFSIKAIMIVRLEFDLIDFGSVEDMGTTLFGVSEDQVVGFRTNNVPSVTAWSERDAKVGIYPLIRMKSCALVILRRTYRLLASR